MTTRALLPFLLCACTAFPPAGEQIAALTESTVAMRAAMLNQSAELQRLIDEVARRGAPPDSVGILRQAAIANAADFQRLYTATLQELQELGTLTVDDVRVLTDATLTELVAWRQARARR